ncbi:hypothetical protein RvY_16083 [Ramazzottius varieornatus]|uniref:Glycosylphosphatidylinositol anchor attachment 1 protein n=1 Tax=Ramazzottius varieornatus TaxID=947166 RepID=A0A1D1W3S4_RAMVA|nr:hypothetical protein RvY_16083 [Ramazzottius varieornatus]
MGLLTDPGKSEQMAKLLAKNYAKLSALAYIVGLCWTFAIVDDHFTLRTYFSENALLPGLVEPAFTSTDEAFAKMQYKLLIDLQRKPDSHFPVDFLHDAFRKLGLEAYVHSYNYTLPGDGHKHGKSVYAILRASRANSQESMVLAAPYRSSKTEKVRTEGGIALLLALAHQFRFKHYWAKDIIFLVTENEHIGAKAWVEAYHGIDSSVVASEPLKDRAGAIQAAITAEIPGPNLDYVDARIVGINGQMPNLDLLNLVRLLCSQQQIPLVIQGNSQLLERTPQNMMGHYLRDLQTASAMVTSAASGQLEGNHGFFQQFNIQSLTLRGLKKDANRNGRIGFLDLGIAFEGICRSLNNLLERFHQSFFFYIMPATQRFVSIGLYMPPLGILVLPLVLTALHLWSKGSFPVGEGNAAGGSSTVGTVLPWIVLSHAIGLGAFTVGLSALSTLPDTAAMMVGLGATLAVAFSTPVLTSRFLREADANLLHSLTLIELAVGLYALSMLNFSLALIVAMIAVPVAILQVPTNRTLRTLLGGLLLVTCPTLVMLGVKVWEGLRTGAVFSLNDLDKVKDEWLLPLSDLFMQYVVYGNWLSPVLCLFLLPVWVCTWMVYWTSG